MKFLFFRICDWLLTYYLFFFTRCVAGPVALQPRWGGPDGQA